MKRHLFNISTLSVLSLLLLGLTATSCSDNDYMESDKGSDQLTLTVDQSTSVLDENTYSSDAVTLNWTTGHNFGSGHRINYRLELAPSGTNFADAYVAVDQEQQTYSWSINQENLNNLILERFGGTVGETMEVEARISAIVSGYDETQTSTVSFSATPYQAVSRTLYLIGDATPNGWSADNATEMERTDNGKFTWQGTLTTGHFKFITTLGNFVPSYNKGATEESLVLRNTFDEPDEQWEITENHDYKITVDLLAMTISIVKTDGITPAYDQLFFVGSMTGWGFVEMTVDALDPFLFRYGRYFSSEDGGEFKFGTADGSWENMYKATQSNAPYTDTSMEFVTGYDPDNKWYLNDNETGKAYKLCVDIRKGSERMIMSEFTPYDMIWLVGDATPNGWDLDNATAMDPTDSPYIFTWTGRLNAGELKFSCDKQSDWGGAWFLAYKSGSEPTGEVEHMLFVDKSSETFKSQYLTVNVGDVDQKWNITSSGTYTITLNQLEETVSIVKN